MVPLENLVYVIIWRPCKMEISIKKNTQAPPSNTNQKLDPGDRGLALWRVQGALVNQQITYGRYLQTHPLASIPG